MEPRGATPHVTGTASQSVALCGLRFLRRRFWLVLCISAALLIPCFWHGRIEAGDLGSHSYNAWLAKLIENEQAPGLYLAPQWNNVLVDVVLTELGSALGFRLAEKMVVSSAVLIYCWGSFAFIAAATGRAPWLLLPGIAMLAYGWTFQMGFMNFYISVALAFPAVALLWRGGGWDYVIAGMLCVLAFVAHPIGCIWLVAGAMYCALSDRVADRFRWILFLAGLSIVAAGHYYVASVFKTYGPVKLRAALYTGPDQLVLYGHAYRSLAGVMFLIGAASFLPAIVEHWRTPEFWRATRTPLELWGIAVFAVAMLWAGIRVPQYAMGVTFLPDRLTSITAILGVCVLGSVRLRRWQFAAMAGCTVIFFGWVYRDTGLLNRMEQHAETLVRRLPAGTRVIATIFPFPHSRVSAVHVVERACIGRCYVYSNYEPSTKQFRIRVSPGSPFAVAEADAGLAMRDGRYVVRKRIYPWFKSISVMKGI